MRFQMIFSQSDYSILYTISKMDFKTIVKTISKMEFDTISKMIYNHAFHDNFLIFTIFFKNKTLIATN